MTYAIIKCTNGHYAVHAEGFADVPSAKIPYHQYVAALWNDADTKTACVKIVDENLDGVKGCIEFICHPEDLNAAENGGDEI